MLSWIRLAAWVVNLCVVVQLRQLESDAVAHQKNMKVPVLVLLARVVAVGCREGWVPVLVLLARACAAAVTHSQILISR
jgi:hypothetical protein